MLSFFVKLFGSKNSLDKDSALILEQTDEKVVVGKILSIRQHNDPKITKVQVTQCDIGKGETRQILCGGQNIRENIVVPIATTGSDLGSGFIIGEREIRGESSCGMICSQKELGLKATSEGEHDIWILPNSLLNKLGEPIKKIAKIL